MENGAGGIRLVRPSRERKRGREGLTPEQAIGNQLAVLEISRDAADTERHHIEVELFGSSLSPMRQTEGHADEQHE